MQSRQSEEAVSLVFTIDKIKQAFNAVVDKWTLRANSIVAARPNNINGQKYGKKNGKFRIYVPHDLNIAKLICYNGCK